MSKEEEMCDVYITVALSLIYELFNLKNLRIVHSRKYGKSSSADCLDSTQAPGESINHFVVRIKKFAGKIAVLCRIYKFATNNIRSVGN